MLQKENFRENDPHPLVHKGLSSKLASRDLSWGWRRRALQFGLLQDMDSNGCNILEFYAGSFLCKLFKRRDYS